MVRRLHGDEFLGWFQVVEAQAAKGKSEIDGHDFLRSKPRTAMTTFAMTESQVRQVRILALRGILDAAASRRFAARLDRLLTAHVRHLVVDLSGVHYVASAGISVLVAGRHRASVDGGSLEITCPSTSVQRIVTMLGLDELMPLHRELHAGVAAVEARLRAG